MNEIFFNPFIGSEYKQGGIMLLGESHTCDEECCSVEDCLKEKDDFCVDGHVRLVKRHILKGNVFTYKIFEKEFTGNYLSVKDDRMSFWNRFFFTNILSVAMKNSSIKEREKQKFYSDTCRERVIDLLDEYKPAYLLVWGNQVYENLPGDQESEMWNHDLSEVYINGNVIKVLTIIHPSAFFRMSSTEKESNFHSVKNAIETFLNNK